MSRRSVDALLAALPAMRKRALRSADVCLRPPLFHPDFPYIVFWSEKAGCTMLARWFFAQVGLLDAALAHDPWIHAYRTEVYARGAGYRKAVRAALSSGDYTVVKVVRHPLRRAVSAFLVLGERGAVGPEAHWVKAYWRTVDGWLLSRGQDPAAGLNFRDHLTLLGELRGQRRVDNHLRPQHVPHEERILHEVIPVERFEAWHRARVEEGRLAAVDAGKAPQQNHHHAADRAATDALGPFPEEARLVRGFYASNRFPDVGAFINPRTAPLLDAIYGADVAAYGTHYGLAGGPPAAA